MDDSIKSMVNSVKGTTYQFVHDRILMYKKNTLGIHITKDICKWQTYLNGKSFVTQTIHFNKIRILSNLEELWI